MGHTVDFSLIPPSLLLSILAGFESHKGTTLHEQTTKKLVTPVVSRLV